MGIDNFCVPCCAVRANPNWYPPEPPCTWRAVEYYEIAVTRAVGLHPADEGIFFEGTCNAYVEICYPDEANPYRNTPVVDVSGVVARTLTVKGTTSPSFNHFAQIRLGPCTKPKLKLIVHHEREGWFCNGDDILGACDLDLRDCELGKPLQLGVDRLPNSLYPGSGHLEVQVVRTQWSGSRGLDLMICRAWNVPQKDALGHCDSYVHVQVLNDKGECEADAKSRVILNERNPMWDDVVTLASTNKRSELKPDSWNLNTTKLRFTVKNKEVGQWDDIVGQFELSLKEFIERPFTKLLLADKAGDPVLDTALPHMPCELVVGVVEPSLPGTWPKPDPEETWSAETYPKHIFMMTRGTRGDVQPFVTLARGMAEMHGWLITICTEYKWKAFVESNATVKRGKIRFRCSGGDTEAQMNQVMSQWALSWRSEMMQMLIMANSESNFYPSCTVFTSHVLEMDREPKPVDLIVFSMTLTGLAAIVGEYCKKPIAGFILQPSCVPSSDEKWTAVQPIDSHGFSWVDRFEERQFTSHDTLRHLKSMTEHSRFSMYNITSMRSWFGLQPAEAYDLMSAFKTPLVIPMRYGTFDEPSDWKVRFNILMTNFIFLRQPKPSSGLLDSIRSKPTPSSTLGKHLGEFIERAIKAGQKLGLMTFSSMPAPLSTVRACCTSMVEECKFNLSMIFVGKQHGDVPKALAEKTSDLKLKGRYIEIDRADFGVLFQYIDLFIVQGGLGTTVEALRRKKPILVSGILLLDQRWWGSTVHTKGIGPEPVHIDNLSDRCVSFANGAIDPADPMGWQKNAKSAEWGDEEDDGVKTNVDCFEKLLNSDLKSIDVPPFFDPSSEPDYTVVNGNDLELQS